MKDHGYIEDYGAILEAIKCDNKKGKMKGGERCSTRVRSGALNEASQTVENQGLAEFFFCPKRALGLILESG